MPPDDLYANFTLFCVLSLSPSACFASTAFAPFHVYLLATVSDKTQALRYCHLRLTLISPAASHRGRTHAATTMFTLRFIFSITPPPIA